MSDFTSPCIPSSARAPQRAGLVLALSLACSLLAHAGGIVLIQRVMLGSMRNMTDSPGDARELSLGLDIPIDVSGEPVVQTPDPVVPQLPIAETLPIDLDLPAPMPDAPVSIPEETSALVPVEIATPSSRAAIPDRSFAIEVKARQVQSVPPAKGLLSASETPGTARRASFAGVAADRARTIVYAVDCSGVMVSSLPFVFAELQRSVARLEADQEFQVVLFHDPIGGIVPDVAGEEPTLESLFRHATLLGDAGKPALLSASVEHKLMLARLVKEARASGPSNPLTGLRIALSLKPDVIFLLSQGIKRSGTIWGPGDAGLLAALDRANPRNPITGARGVQIRTVQFISKDPSGLMDRIAHEHGGSTCAIVTIADLKKLARPVP
jgi:hypothetical protein